MTSSHLLFYHVNFNVSKCMRIYILEDPDSPMELKWFLFELLYCMLSLARIHREQVLPLVLTIHGYMFIKDTAELARFQKDHKVLKCKNKKS
mmetsp:Transcript_31257/g.45551  ORF Transcript_31257/g.45551 Transcript_31257/m.45551 type:complete len:92 (-) Transcript_31257:24-299(-)